MRSTTPLGSLASEQSRITLRIDNSSGAAKLYDFQRVNSLLITKAERLERAERQMMFLAAKWMGVDLDEEHSLIAYPESFDIRGLTDEFAVAEKLGLLEAPDSVRRYQMEMLIEKIFPNISAAMQKEFEKDLLNFPPKMLLTPLKISQYLLIIVIQSKRADKIYPKGMGTHQLKQPSDK